MDKKNSETQVVYSVGGVGVDNEVVKCCNLRRVREDGEDILAAVGTPAKIGVCQGRPLHSHSHSDGSFSVFFLSGTTLYVVHNGVGRTLATLPSADVALACSADKMLVMAGARRPFLAELSSATGRWEWRGEMPRVPMPGLVAVAAGTIKQILPARYLSQAYDTESTSLDLTDTKTLSADFLKAYERLAQKALAAGAYLQPVMARLVAKTASGYVLSKTAPTLLTPPVDNALNCMSTQRTLENQGEGYRQVLASALSAVTYYPKLLWPELTPAELQLWNEWVATVEVELTPQFHPANMDADADNRITRATATNRLTVTLALPGTNLSGAVPPVLRSRILKGVERFSDLGETARCITAPSPQSWAQTMSHNLTAFRPVALQVKDETALVDNTLKKAAAKTFNTGAWEDFAAGAALTAGDTTVWGDIVRRPPEAPRPAELAAGVAGNTPWSGWTAVGYDERDASARQCCMLREFSYTKNLPAAFSPLIFVPDSRARTITLTVGSGSFTADLTPTSDGSGAVWLADDLRPVVCSQAAPAKPSAAEPTPLHYASVALMAASESPLDIAASASVGEGTIRAFLPADRGLTGWTYSNAKFYVQATSGIFSLVANAGLTAVRCSQLDDRRVASPQAWTSTSSGAVCVVGSSLVAIRGNRLVTLVENVNASALAWNAAYNELWTLASDGTVRVYNLQSLEYYDRTLPVTHMLSQGGRMVLSDGLNISLAATETFPPGGVEVEWRARRKVSLLPQARMFLVDGSGTGVNLTLTASAEGGAGSYYAARVAKFAVSGDWNHTFVARIAAPRRRYISVEAAGTVNADFRLQSATIWMN